MTDRPIVTYAREPGLAAVEFRQVLLDSGLSSIRPVDDLPRLEAMLNAADLIVTARLASTGALVGVARGVTDFAWICYMSEVAVSRSAQGLGIGNGLMDETRQLLGPKVALVLASVPEAVGFYERIGMERVADAFWYPRKP
ncbi:MAG: family acetyltransferase [Xanthobacteraceae bacterium]|jgi:ribosomal protein S18 acetylase RimI-like enzyme|nr:family acetyltransferase [Xanthobacteraceae bacterium]